MMKLMMKIKRENINNQLIHAYIYKYIIHFVYIINIFIIKLVWMISFALNEFLQVYRDSLMLFEHRKPHLI